MSGEAVKIKIINLIGSVKQNLIIFNHNVQNTQDVTEIQTITVLTPMLPFYLIRLTIVVKMIKSQN